MGVLQSGMAEYLDNLKQIKVLSDFRLGAVGDTHEQIEAIRADARAIFALQDRNNQLLNAMFFNCELTGLSEEEARAWDEFAIGLVDGYKQLDLGLAYRLHCMLLDWARLTGRREEELRQLYYCGLTLYYLESPLFSYKSLVVDARIRAYFQAGMDFLSEYPNLSRESRAFIMRCAGNLRLGMQVPGPVWYCQGQSPESHLNGEEEINSEELLKVWLEDFDKAYALITNPELQAMEPDLPWENYLYNMHFGRTTLASAVRDGIGGEELVQMVYESACYVYQRQEQAARGKNIALPGRLVYVYAAARYHRGIISAEELVEILLEEAEQAYGREISAETTYRVLGLSAYLRYYLAYCTPEGQKRLRKRVERAAENASRYLDGLSKTEYFSQTTSYIRNLVELEITHTKDESGQSRKEALLRLLLLCHRPTYIHCMTVAWLERRLIQRMMEVQPETFLTPAAGIYRCSTLEEVQARRGELLELAYDVGLYHDVGKIGILDVVALYGRRLNREEFEVIQHHPYIGYVILTSLGGMPVCAEGALNHHRYYSDQGGYPSSSGGRETLLCAVMTDVLSVADSVDAATDDVGRSYARAKKLGALVQEMHAMRDARYAGYVLDLLEDGDFCATLERELKETRQDIYLYAYRSMD